MKVESSNTNNTHNTCGETVHTFAQVTERYLRWPWGVVGGEGAWWSGREGEGHGRGGVRREERVAPRTNGAIPVASSGMPVQVIFFSFSRSSKPQRFARGGRAGVSGRIPGSRILLRGFLWSHAGRDLPLPPPSSPHTHIHIALTTHNSTSPFPSPILHSLPVLLTYPPPFPLPVSTHSPLCSLFMLFAFSIIYTFPLFHLSPSLQSPALFPLRYIYLLPFHHHIFPFLSPSPSAHNIPLFPPSPTTFPPSPSLQELGVLITVLAPWKV